MHYNNEYLYEGDSNLTSDIVATYSNGKIYKGKTKLTSNILYT